METKGIIEDSMKMLAFIYRKEKTDSNEIIQESGFEEHRVLRAIKFLQREGLITHRPPRSNRWITSIECDNEGIKLIEYPNQHLNNLNIQIVFNIDSLFKVNLESIFKTDSVVKFTAFG